MRDPPTWAPDISSPRRALTIRNQPTGLDVDARTRQRARPPSELPLSIGPLRRLPENLDASDEEGHRLRDLVGEEPPSRDDLDQIPTYAEPVVFEDTISP